MDHSNQHCVSKHLHEINHIQSQESDVFPPVAESLVVLLSAMLAYGVPPSTKALHHIRPPCIISCTSERRLHFIQIILILSNCNFCSFAAYSNQSQTHA
ncbi:uncharacterized protein LAJ45_01032 [Morchella importuna]|uniref:uncharacterized protein n=1 Tax=Morchella importuna TaxID=1174673 RepID=UPI001E8D0862|nr:uncharacterized protein LAJ45_01032 [Morchella importuna]KAH8154504.1 hypothetical protein LAJ45_01032 [Morchella importuna]